jgi:hypothetical protein
MAIISANMAKQFDANIKKMFFMEFMQYKEMEKLVNMKGSSKPFERVATVGEMPMPGKVGQYETIPEARFLPGPQREWIHEKYAFKVIASEEMIDDELFNVVSRSGQAVGVAMRHRYETQGVYDYDTAFTLSTVGPNDTASETLCATAHATFPGAGGASQSNRPAVDITFGVDALWDAVNNFTQLTDREGNPIAKIPKKIVIHPLNKREVGEVLRSSQIPYLMNNEKNVIADEGIVPAYSHYMASTMAWFLSTEESPIDFYTRKAASVVVDDNAINQSRAWIISTRISHGPRSWENIYGTSGA